MTADSLPSLLRSLGLGVMVREHEVAVARAEKENWGYQKFLHYLAEEEVNDKQARRIQRLLKDSDLPKTETLERLSPAKMPEKARRMLPTLLTGEFVARGDNLIAIGLHGRGKTGFCAAVGRALVERHQLKVLFIPTFKLVSQLLAAKRDLRLPEALARLNRYDLVHVDELSYVTQNRDEVDVLFNFFAERYEKQRSVTVTASLVFSQWDKIFKDAMTAAAVVDRLVHRAILLEFPGKSIRAEEAEAKQREAI
ncbi:MAG: ATP-binding protein [Candidatus Bipolaricaulota bacterium]|nr:ATP-binding protein [Candidatus Bipolaricaulota bacterium]